MLPPKLRRTVTLLTRLPGVGEKTAMRYALHLVANDARTARELGEELVALEASIGPCSICGNLAERTRDACVCSICTDPQRDARILCVVSRITDLFAIERAGSMRGRYFVLGKLLSPLDGVTPEDLPIPRLRDRIVSGKVEELIVATPPSVDGEATALLLKRELSALVQLSRIASGVPHGGDLEFADPITMSRALSGRQHI